MFNFSKLLLFYLLLFSSCKPMNVIHSKEVRTKYKLLRENDQLQKRLIKVLIMSMQADLGKNSFITTYDEFGYPTVKLNKILFTQSDIVYSIVDSPKFRREDSYLRQYYVHLLFIIDKIISSVERKRLILNQKYISKKMFSNLNRDFLLDYFLLKEYLYLFMATTVNPDDMDDYIKISNLLKFDRSTVSYEKMCKYISLCKKHCDEMIECFFSVFPEYFYKKNRPISPFNFSLRAVEKYVISTLRIFKIYNYCKRDINSLIQRVESEIYF